MLDLTCVRLLLFSVGGNENGCLLTSVLYHPHFIWTTYPDQNHQTMLPL
jgi:hypothetical protein